MAEDRAPALSVRFCEIPELADSNWVPLTQGITVLTERNNVGKRRWPLSRRCPGRRFGSDASAGVLALRRDIHLPLCR